MLGQLNYMISSVEYGMVLKMKQIGHENKWSYCRLNNLTGFILTLQFQLLPTLLFRDFSDSEDDGKLILYA